MRFMKRIAVTVLVGAAFVVHAQQPASVDGGLESLDRIHSRTFGALDLPRLAEEDSQREALGGAQRFAVKHTSGITPAQSGTWEQVGELSVWRYRVVADTTASFNFGFSRFRLPEGASLFVYSADGRFKAGPYTAAKNAAHGQLWTPVIPSSDVVIELNVPTSARHQVELVLDSINQGYRGFGIDAGDYHQPMRVGTDGKPCVDGGGNRSAACNTDVACLNDDDPWNEPRRSVAALLINGVLNCTGSLLNNTANDGRMLLATATHCGVNAASTPTLVAHWNYEWPTCRRPGASDGTLTNPPDPSISTTGATFLAATENPFQGQCTSPGRCSDFTLVEFADAPDPAWNLYWAGWDRGTSDHLCSNPADPASTDSLCASIHHPRVDEKRITFVDQNLITANISGAQGVHWFARWDHSIPVLPRFPAGGTLPPSVTEGGSSGSPLYNAQKRFVGVLSGGASFCGAAPASLTDQYGKLAHAWDGLGTASTRVRDYLDPLGTGATTLDGRSGGPDPEPPVAGSIEDGTVEREFGQRTADPFNSPGANGSDGTLNSAGDDIMFKTNWYFRVAGTARETMFGRPDGMIYHASGDRATLFYSGLGGGAFDAELDVTVSEPAAGQALQISNLKIINLGATPLTIDVFNYSDLDADGEFGGNSATDVSEGGHRIIRVTRNADVLQIGGRLATAHQVNEWSAGATALPQTLENTDITNLDNSGLPFGPGDFTSTLQWATQSVPGNGSITLMHGIARGVDLAPIFGGQPLPSADLGLTLTAAPDPVAFGSTVTLTGTVNNAGPGAATGVSVTVTLPAALTFQSSTPGTWACTNASGVVTCNLSGSLASGTSAPALAIVAEATGTGTATVDAEVDSGQTDPVPGNNAASINIGITGGPVIDLIFANGFEDAGPVECLPLQLLQDPSFETTTSNAGPNTFWAGTDSASTSGGSPFWSFAARTGSRGAYGGGWGRASTQTWSQRVTIPAGSPRFLNFWRNIDSAPVGGTAVLKAFIDGTEVHSFDALTNGVDGAFVSTSVDVSSFANGAEREVKFEYAATGSNDGDVFVDDVTLECQAAPTMRAPARPSIPSGKARSVVSGEHKQR